MRQCLLVFPLSSILKWSHFMLCPVSNHVVKLAHLREPVDKRIPP